VGSNKIFATKKKKKKMTSSTVRNLSDIRSTLNERLHPRIDPTDKYDSMKDRFQSHLRRVAEPQPRPEFVDHGKRFDLSKRRHDPIFEIQLHHMQPRESTILNSSLQTTRFHHGFMRSNAAQKDFYSRVEQERESQTARRDKGICHDRDVYISRRPELQPGNEGSLNFKAEPKPIQPLEPKSDARKYRILQDSKSPFDPPPPPSLLRNVSDRRKEQVAREGLTESRKLLSVGNTIGAMDGFATSGFLPQISEQRKARVILGKQNQSQWTLG
jgi:hypothetical protein